MKQFPKRDNLLDMLRDRIVAGWDIDIEEARRLGRDGYCWIWNGALTKGGYGIMRVSKKYAHLSDRVYSSCCQSTSHRWTYRSLRGPIPDGLTLDHLCRMRSCVNPWHLDPVSMRENILRGDTLAARNAAKTHCIHGHEFTPENTGHQKSGKYCMECKRMFNRECYARKRAAKLMAKEEVFV